MTAKDYIRLANSLRKTMPRPDDAWPESVVDALKTSWCDVCEGLAKDLKRDNPRFKFDKFMDACLKDYLEMFRTYEITKTKIVKIDDEYVVRAYNGTKRVPDADYFTDDRDDAAGTAKAMVKA